MNLRTQHIQRWLTILAVAALMVVLASCEMPPPAAQTQSQEPATEPTEAGEATPPIVDPDAPVGVLIHRIDMPLDVSLDDCWALVDETAVPTLTHGMWKTNGLRIGVLHTEQAQAFAEALPEILGESRGKLLGSEYLNAVRSTPRLQDPVPVDLTDPPRNPTIYRAVDGRLQLLARVRRFPETGQPFIEITPHHYKPKPDLIPRNPLDKALDGKVFTPLTARMPLTPDTAIVLGLYRPWPKAEIQPEDGPEDKVTNESPNQSSEETTDKATENTNSDQPETHPPSATDHPPSPTPEPPPIPESLGKSLMAGLRAGQETQILIVFTVILEEPAAQPADAAN